MTKTTKKPAAAKSRALKKKAAAETAAPEKPEDAEAPVINGLTAQFINFDVAQNLTAYLSKEIGEHPFGFMLGLATMCAVINNAITMAPNADEKGRQYMRADVLHFLNHLFVYGYVMPDGSPPRSVNERLH